MARRKAVTTYVRELEKVLSPEQLRELSSLALEAADKPQLDKKAHAKARKAVQNAYAKLLAAEVSLTDILAEAGRTNAEINEEIRELRQAGERTQVSAPARAAK